MSHYKLHYFDFRGRGEPIRQLFKAAGKEFEDVRYTFETWPQHKKDMPLGQMPVLEVEGEKLCQSLAILRYLGNQFDMAGSTPLEKARLDMIADSVEEMRNAAIPTGWGLILRGVTKCDDKLAYYKEHVQPTMDKYAPGIEKFLERNGNGFFVGDKVTWVDIYASEVLGHRIDYGDPHTLDAYPNILKMIETVRNLPSIKKHIEERKPCPI